MRDRWVIVYVLLVLIQLPICYSWGRANLEFDFAMQKAEAKLAENSPVLTRQDQDSIAGLLQKATDELDELKDQSSRRARVEMGQSLLAWRIGDADKSVEALARAREIFVATHGADSFHVSAIELRLGELLYLRRHFAEATVHFQKGRVQVTEFLGPRDPFSVRSAFREVSALIALGREGEAAGLALKNLSHLMAAKANLDLDLLTSIAANLDQLALKALIPRPSGTHQNWRSVLLDRSDQKR